MKLSLVICLFLFQILSYSLPMHYVSTNNINIGDTFLYTIELPPGIPDVLTAPTINGVEKLSEKVNYGQNSTRYEFQFQVFTIDSVVIPTYSLTSINGLDPIELNPIILAVNSLLSPTMNQLNDISPLFKITQLNGPVIITLILILGAIAALAWFKRRSRKEDIEILKTDISPDKIALNQLNALLREIINDPAHIKKAYFDSTEIFYRYLTAQSKLNFSDATTVEIKRLLKLKKPFSSSISNQIVTIALSTDECKFSKNPTLILSQLEDTVKKMKVIIKGVSN
ncbi:MAG: hypothetical protein VW397_02025 [Candidatus Margulisiibacteriota bacterium]